MLLLGCGLVAPAIARTLPEDVVPVHALVTGSGFTNLVKLGNVVLDDGRRRGYFTANLSPYIAVLDLDSLQLLGLVDSNIDGFLSKHLMLNASNGVLYAQVIENDRLYRIDPSSGAVSGPITAGGGSAVDESTGRLFVSTSTNAIGVYDGALTLLGTITNVTSHDRHRHRTDSHRTADAGRPPLAHPLVCLGL